MRKLTMAVAVVLAGCVSPPMSIERARTLAHSLQDWDLCYLAASPRTPAVSRQAVNETLAWRSTNCAPYASTVQTRVQADMQAAAQSSAAQTATGLWLLNAGRPQAAPMPNPVRCRSVFVGGGLNTICD